MEKIAESQKVRDENARKCRLLGRGVWALFMMNNPGPHADVPGFIPLHHLKQFGDVDPVVFDGDFDPRKEIYAGILDVRSGSRSTWQIEKMSIA